MNAKRYWRTACCSNSPLSSLRSMRIAYTNVFYWSKALDFLRLYVIIISYYCAPNYVNFTREMKARMNELTNACCATLLSGAPCRIVNQYPHRNIIFG